MVDLKLAELHDRQYLETKFQENLHFSLIVSWGVAVLAVGLWVLDWSIDRGHAFDTIGLRLLMGVAVMTYPIIVHFKLRRELFPVVTGIVAFAIQVMFSLILNRIDHGVEYGIGGYLYFFLSFTLVSTVMSIRASVLILAILALGPSITSVLMGMPNGLDLIRYNAFALPAMGIVVFTCYVIDLSTYSNYMSQQAMKRLSDTDALTGCSSRRHVFERGDQFFEDARRYGRPFAVLTLDLDFFKKINDVYGHPAGDAALQHASRVFSGELRASDSLGRLGGEEFLALLPGTNLASAMAVAERMVATLAQTPVDWPQAPDGHIPLTVSIGVAGLDLVGPGDSLEVLVTRSDDALYEAKASGRSRAMVWSEQRFESSTR